ncbi:MAG TPA: hypothetical protein VH720_06665 [Candidatus Limnocylindrales bacterium]|jgi:hypothetical protein
MKKQKKRDGKRQQEAPMTTEDRPPAGHHRADAHGIAPRVPTDLPGTREELLALHALERRRRAEAELGGDAFRQASERIAEIEVHLARIERRLDPPRV